MTLMPATAAKIEWSPSHKRWEVHIEVGAEVIKRPIPDSENMAPEALTARAVEIAKDEGYALDPAKITVGAH